MLKKTKLPMFIAAFVFISFIIGVILLSVSYTNVIYNSMKKDSDLYINEVTKQIVSSLENKIHKDTIIVRNASKLLNQSGELDVSSAINSLSNITEMNEFDSMAISLPNGETHYVDGRVENMSNSPFFKQGMVGITGITEPMPDLDNKNYNVYYAPIINGNDIIGVISANQSTETFQHSINLSTFDGAGYAYISNNKGMLLACSDNKEIDNSNNALLDLTDGTQPQDFLTLQRVQDNIQSGVSGVAEYTNNGQKQYMRYTPLSVNNWYLISILPQTFITQKTDVIIQYTFAIAVAILVVFIGLFTYILIILRKSRKNLMTVAYVDPVTKFANVNSFKREATELLKRRLNRNYALIDFDIDNFKYINDIYGYEAGNVTLRHIANVLDQNLGINECFGHGIGDHFHAMLTYTDEEDLLERTKILTKYIEEMPSYNNKHFEFNISMGIYKVVDKELDLTAMIDRVTIARKSVKTNRMSKYAFYTEKMRDKMTREKEIENDMVAGVARHEFEVYYQPKFYTKTEKIAGAEALVRWNHPQKGLISPVEFIPVFEKNGFIITLDEYIFEEICINMSNWKKQGKKVVPVSFNLSRVHMYESNLAQRFKSILDKYDIPGRYMEFEITETTAIENTDRLASVLKSLHEIGCLVSMDDFGSGYSSLNMLKEVAVDILKIDREFFNTSVHDYRSKEIVTSVIMLAKNLNITVVAEGIEHEEQLEFLRKIDCDIIQGYIFSKPLRLAEFERRLLNEMQH